MKKTIVDFEKLAISEISLHDPVRRYPNDVPKNWVVEGKSGINSDSLVIVPSQVLGEMATLMLTPQEFLDLIRVFPICVPSAVSENSKNIPIAGQRWTTTQRSKSIQVGMRDQNRCPEQHCSTILMFAFGVKCDKNGIHFSKDSAICVTDGAGRTSAFVTEYNELMLLAVELSEHFAFKNKHCFQVNINVSGDRKKCLQEFLLHNRDAKKCSRGTIMAVENGLLTHCEEVEDYDDELWATYVVNKIYKNSKITGTILELLPWSMEGHESSNSVFRGIGRAQNLNTALRKMEDHLRDSGISIKQLPKVLDFALTSFFQMCPLGVVDAHKALEQHSKSERKLHTTLALKVMVWLITKVFPLSGYDFDEFEKLCNNIVNEHFDSFKKLFYSNPKSKKMDLDKFWGECTLFGAMFNSGEKNTQLLLEQLEFAWKKFNT